MFARGFVGRLGNSIEIAKRRGRFRSLDVLAGDLRERKEVYGEVIGFGVDFFYIYWFC